MRACPGCSSMDTASGSCAGRLQLVFAIQIGDRTNSGTDDNNSSAWQGFTIIISDSASDRKLRQERLNAPQPKQGG